MSSVLVARFEGCSELAPIVRAALDVDIVYVPLAAPPPAGRQTLQLYVGGELVAAVVAELVGSGREGAYPLRVRLIDPAHAEEFALIAQSRDSRPASAAEDRTLTSRGDDWMSAARLDDRTLVSRPGDLPPPSSDTEIVPTSIFGPEPSRLLEEAMPDRVSIDGHEDMTLQRPPGSANQAPSSGRRRGAFFSDEESQTLPGSIRLPGTPGADPHVSWNVRIAPTTRDPLCGRTIGGGKYVLASVIGTGAIGIVFKASHRELGRTVAIKVLNPHYRDNPDLLAVFRTEARAASQLEHPNVARVYDYGQEPDGLVYIVMEYLSGYTLGSVLDARLRLAPSRAIDVMVQVCAGLSAAHDRAIVHRDVKPDNIVLVPAQDDEGNPVEIVKVCDFGIAALGTTPIEQGVAAGTAEYMSPEQTLGAQVQPSADVYACGIVLYEMLSGALPFTADQAFRILMKQRDELPRPPSTIVAGIPPLLEAVVLRCMEKSPALRYQSARELRVELRKIDGARVA